MVGVPVLSFGFPVAVAMSVSVIISERRGPGKRQEDRPHCYNLFVELHRAASVLN
jgi:hypothetical protein